jgi:hypothetical protein
MSSQPSRDPATGRVRLFLFIEGMSFTAASLVHAGRLVKGYEHPRARIAEAIIALVLVAGLAWIWIRPSSTRPAGLVAQGFALAGTLVGVFTSIVGVGPRTLPDIVYHLVVVLLLVLGLKVTASPEAAGEP